VPRWSTRRRAVLAGVAAKLGDHFVVANSSVAVTAVALGRDGDEPLARTTP
jgi:hypothetical protein